mmetsp:Transcript_91048/g.293992  ORF Transcript_91048/g.293992 Transcript_91048/m.293992 type:complete len:246 (+) Transcript_91048:58-795(+)
MTSGPPWVCEFCVGSGNVNEESTRPCANCKGEGSLRAGRGNTYVCTVCNGEGDHTITKEVKCTDCKGTGHAMRSQAQQPRPKAKSRSQGAVAPPAGADEEDEDLEGGDGAESEGSQDRKDTAAASSGRVSTLASAAAAKLAGKKAPADKAQKREEHEHRGVRWAPNEGLVIEVTVSPRALMNSIGTVLLLLGLILMVMQSMVWYLLGAICVFFSLGFLLKANAEKLAGMFPQLTPPSTAAAATAS